MAIVIEKLTEKYASSVADLESKLIAKTSVESVLKTLKSDVVVYFVLKENDILYGFLQCSIIAPESELFEIAIAEEYQQKGLATMLLKFYLDFAKEKGCDTILLEVNNINMKAINLYKKFGFCEYGKRKNYYGNNDAILMKLKI